MHTRFCLFLVAFLFAPLATGWMFAQDAASDSGPAIYKDALQPVKARIADLLPRLTEAEKMPGPETRREGAGSSKP